MLQSNDRGSEGKQLHLEVRCELNSPCDRSDSTAQAEDDSHSAVRPARFRSGESLSFLLSSNLLLHESSSLPAAAAASTTTSAASSAKYLHVWAGPRTHHDNDFLATFSLDRNNSDYGALVCKTLVNTSVCPNKLVMPTYACLCLVSMCLYY